MIDTDKLYEGIKNLIGIKDFYDATEIPSTGLETSESGEFYNLDYLPYDLDVIKASIPTNRDLTEYLNTRIKSGVVYLANKLKLHKTINKAIKTQLTNFTLFPVGGWKNNTVAKNDRFVGMQFTLLHEIGLKTVLNRIGVQFTQAQTDLELHLFHSSQIHAPIATIVFSTTHGLSWHWLTQEVQELYADNQTLTGGTYLLGYYEDEIAGNAITYKTEYFNYNTGYCGSCGYEEYSDKYSKFSKWVRLNAFSFKSGDFIKGEMPNTDLLKVELDTNFGLNLNINIECDITNYFIENRSQLTTALGNAVAYKMLKDVEYSQQNNFVNDDLIGSVQVEMNGTPELNVDTVGRSLMDSINSLTIDQNDLGSVCFPCSLKGGVRYGVV